MIQLSVEDSRMMFCLIIVLAPFILQLRKYAKNNITRDIFVLISFLMIFIPLGFRSGGIDHNIYRMWYENPALVLKNPLTPEPLYAALSLLASHIHCFQICYIIPAFLFTSGLLYYTIKRADDFFCTTIIVLMSIYIYMCGVTRYSAALGLLWIAFENFDKKNRFFTLVILASLFHYAAIIGIFIYIVYKSNKAITVKNIVLFLIGWYVVLWLIERFANNWYVLGRLSQYSMPSFDISALKNATLILPAFIIMLFNYSIFQKIYCDAINIRNIFVIIFAFIMVQVFMPGTFRLLWPFMVFVGDVYGRLPRVIMQNKNAMGTMIVYKLILAFVAIAFQYIVFFNSPYITKLIIPFSFNI